MLWAVGMVIALVALGLLVAKLYPSIWEPPSRERVATLIGIGVALTVIIVLLALGGASLGWTGFADKKLWDWLQLLSALAIPIVLAAAGFWFTAQQDQRQQQIEEKRAQREQEIEAQRAERERNLEEQRAQDEALQAYLDQMNTLYLEEDLSDAKVRTLLRARTLTVLERLDPRRKTQVTQFLSEAELVTSVDGREPIIALDGASLSNADLRFLDLRGAYLLDADLSNAHLFNTDLSDADLRAADLSNAALLDADLSDADLSAADLSNADLRVADLSNAHLLNAALFDADLSNADLSNADLSNAYLLNADLSNAVGVTKERLEQQTRALAGAIMPDGQEYEDWLKSKGSGEDGENSGPS